MSTFNRKFIANVQEVLTSEYLACEDFDLTTDLDNKVNVLEVRYKYNPSFYFKARVLNNGKSFIELSPGEIVTDEKCDLKDVGSLYSLINDWTARVDDEISAIPQTRALNSYRDDLNKFMETIYDKVGIIQDGFFTNDEINTCVERLDNLEKDFRDQLSNAIEEKQSLKEEIEVLRKDIELLKAQTSLLTKSNWISSFASKMFKWGTRNPNTVKALSGVAVELLPAEIKSHIPNDLFLVNKAPVKQIGERDDSEIIS